MNNQSLDRVRELEDKITDIFITIDNYGTAEEARADIRNLINSELQNLRQELVGEVEGLKLEVESGIKNGKTSQDPKAFYHNNAIDIVLAIIKGDSNG